MIVRLAAIVAMLATFVALGAPWNDEPVGGFQTATAAAAPVAAPAATWTDGIQFSTDVSSEARPHNPRTVWASFQYHDHDQNAKVSYLVRANGEDYKFGKLDCCGGSNGRYAFPITRRSGNGDLPGAAYDVRVYVNDVEVAQGGFGVNGREGLDHDGQGSDNGNDNGS